MQSFKEDGRDLLLDDLLAGLSIDPQNDAGEVESVIVGVSELVHNRVEEAEPGVVVEAVHYLLESVSVLD